MTSKLFLELTGDSSLTVTRESAPKLFEAWDAWRAAEHGSNREAHLWIKVLDYAGLYLDEQDIESIRYEEINDVREVEA